MLKTYQIIWDLLCKSWISVLFYRLIFLIESSSKCEADTMRTQDFLFCITLVTPTFAIEDWKKSALYQGNTWNKEKSICKPNQEAFSVCNMNKTAK